MWKAIRLFKVHMYNTFTTLGWSYSHSCPLGAVLLHQIYMTVQYISAFLALPCLACDNNYYNQKYLLCTHFVVVVVLHFLIKKILFYS